MSLTDLLPNFIAVHFVQLSPIEEQLYQLRSRGLDAVRVPRYSAAEIERLRDAKERMAEILKGYDGRFKEYFSNTLDVLTNEERFMLGYKPASSGNNS